MAILETCACGGFLPEHVEACPNCGVFVAAVTAGATKGRRGAIRRAAAAAAGSLLVMTVSACYGGAVQPRPAEAPPATEVAGDDGATTGDETGAGTTDADAALCDEAECGPRMGMPAEQCADGSVGGNIGRCLHHPDGTCGWEVRACPEP